MMHEPCWYCGYPYTMMGECNNCQVQMRNLQMQNPRAYWAMQGQAMNRQIESNGGCFITTAVCEFAGLGDDCEELTQLRGFRDRRMLTSDDDRTLLSEYYVKAPALVDILNQRQDRAELYATLLDDFILPAVDAAKARDDDRARAIYIDGMQWLRGVLASD